MRVKKLVHRGEGFLNCCWRYQTENLAWCVMLHVESSRKWEKPKDPSEVDREDMNEGRMPRRSGGGAAV